MSKSMRSTEKKKARGKISEREDINGGVRTESRMREKQNERGRDEDRERGKRERPKGCGVHNHFAWLHCD